jgi:hypothetical protein
MSHVRRAASRTAIALSVVLFTQSAAAQVGVVSVEPSREGQPATSFFVGYHHQFQTDIDAGGHFSRESVLARGAHRAKLGDNWSFTTQITYQGSYYDMGGWDSNAQGFGFPYGWGDIHEATLTGILGWNASENWELLAALLGKTAGEGGADFNDTLTGGGALGFMYHSSPDFQIGMLVGLLSQLEDDAQIIPLPMIDWKMSDHWKLHLGLTLLDHVGYGGEISFLPSEAIELSVGGTYEKRRFRLDDGGLRTSWIGEETSFPIYAKLGWHPDENITLALTGSVAFAGQVRMGNGNGTKLPNGLKDYDPAPGVGFQAQFRF